MNMMEHIVSRCPKSSRLSRQLVIDGEVYQILYEDIPLLLNFIEGFVERKEHQIQNESEQLKKYLKSSERVIDDIIKWMQYCELKHEPKMRMKLDELKWSMKDLHQEEKEKVRLWIEENGGISSLILVPQDFDASTLFNS